MSALVHIPAHNEAPAQREAYGSGGKEQGRGHGFHRSHKLGDHDQIASGFRLLLREEYEPKASAAQVLDGSKARNKHVRDDARFTQSGRLFKHVHSNPPQLWGDADAAAYDGAITSGRLLTAVRSRGYSWVNADITTIGCIVLLVMLALSDLLSIVGAK